MRKCLIHGAAAAAAAPTNARDAIHENRACLVCGESTRLPDGSWTRTAAAPRRAARDVPRLLGAATAAADVALRYLC